MTDPSIEIDRAQQAQDILSHPLVADFFSEAEASLWEAFKRSPLRDAEGREKLRLMLHWLNQFKGSLETHIQTGKLAMMQEEERRTIADRLKEATSALNPWS